MEAENTDGLLYVPEGKLPRAVKKTPRRPVLAFQKPPTPAKAKAEVLQIDLCECVALRNQIRMLRIELAEKRASIRRRLKAGQEVEDGALKSFARQIAKGKFL